MAHLGYGKDSMLCQTHLHDSCVSMLLSGVFRKAVVAQCVSIQHVCLYISCLPDCPHLPILIFSTYMRSESSFVKDYLFFLGNSWSYTSQVSISAYFEAYYPSLDEGNLISS